MLPVKEEDELSTPMKMLEINRTKSIKKLPVIREEVKKQPTSRDLGEALEIPERNKIRIKKTQEHEEVEVILEAF
jgi:hypothetical protein